MEIGRDRAAMINETDDRAVRSRVDLDSSRVQATIRQLSSGWKLKLYLLAKLPLALVAGLRVDRLDAERCSVSLPYGWRTTNPFRSMYFAAQAMAAEFSTGALAAIAVRGAERRVSMLITGLEAEFVKKADSRTTFSCTEGPELVAAVERALVDPDGSVATVETVGRNADGTEVARFRFSWSFRAKPPKS